MGAPRYTGPRSPHTSVPTATGVYSDMGAFEFAETATSEVDLVVDSVTGPASALAGNEVQLSWTDNNIGSASAIGPWHDADYLVRDAGTNPVEIFAFRKFHNRCRLNDR